MFCGLGIGNFAALTAADVGFAVGSNEAIVAAQIMTRNTSIAGMHSPDLQCNVSVSDDDGGFHVFELCL